LTILVWNWTEKIAWFNVANFSQYFTSYNATSRGVWCARTSLFCVPRCSVSRTRRYLFASFPYANNAIMIFDFNYSPFCAAHSASQCIRGDFYFFRAHAVINFLTEQITRARPRTRVNTFIKCMYSRAVKLRIVVGNGRRRRPLSDWTAAILSLIGP